MTNPLGFGSGSFEEFLARVFGGVPQSSERRVDIGRLMSQSARELVAAAAAQAAQWRSRDLDTEHLLWAAASREPTRSMIATSGVDPDRLAEEVQRELAPPESAESDGAGPPQAVAQNLTPAVKRALLDAHRLSRSQGSTYIGPEHLLLALAANPDSGSGRLLRSTSQGPDALQRAMPNPAGGGGRGERPSQTPTLDSYGQDLTAAARDGTLDPVVGRADEIDQTIEILSRRTKNNPVLIGEAGVGKTAIVEGIAQRVVDGDVPQVLAAKRVVQLDLPGVVAGTRYRGDFEERLKKIIDEIRAHASDLVIFIDELHTMVGAGTSTEGSMDAGNMLKPALARGELHVVGATTLDEFRRNIEKDPALARRFQPVFVSEPGVTDTISILRVLRDRYEAHHQVRFTDEALVAAAELSDRYLTDRFLPDKAIDVMDQTGARVRLRTTTPTSELRELEEQLEQANRDKAQAVADEDYERASALRDQIESLRGDLERRRAGGATGVPEVGVPEIAEVISRTTGIPVAQLTEEERSRLLRLEEQLHERVIGQEEAVGIVAESVRRSRAGLGDPGRPIGSFLFLGPTGVGKTELARALAEALFGDQDLMVRLDMSEFQERHTVSRLVGAPPGYVGYEEAGQLTESVRRRPYSVLLLDEIEKAHPDVFNTLLQVLDDGRLTDAQGRTVNFTNTVLIMTSNIGSELITRRGPGLGFAAESEEGAHQPLIDQIMPRLRDHFRPEFLNRIDDIVVFRQLEPGQLRRIARLLLGETERRLHGQDISVEVSDAAVAWLAERGYQPEFGARPLRRTIQRELDNRLSAMLLSGELRPGDRVRVDAKDDDLTIDASHPESAVPAR